MPQDRPIDPDAEVNEATRKEERKEARAAHDAGRPPTEDEDRAAPTEVDPVVAEHYQDMAEKGADAKGEGRIEP